MIGNVRKRLHDAFDIDVPHNRLKKLKISYVENDWKFPEEKKKSGRPRMLSPFGEKQVLSDITGHTQRATARNCEFESNKENCMVSPSRTTLGRVAKRGGLVIAEPKIVRITKYSDHHKKMRVLHAQWFLALPQVQQQQIWYSDEMGFPVTLTPNKKNDVYYVKKGEQTKSNVHRVTKGAMGQMCSLFWVISYEGVQAVKLYTEKLTVQLFNEFLLALLPTAIEEKKRSGHKLSYFYHDHVTNSAELYDAAEMDRMCGKGKWLQFAPKVCREQNGFIQMPAVDNGRRKIKAYKRRRMVPKKICDCQPELKGRFVPSAAPDDNLIENVNGYLRQTLWQMCQSGEEEWKGSVETKMNIIRRAINKINNDRSYFWRLYRSHPDRCRRIIVSGGEIS